ncbi:Fic family protein [Undibacterium sp. Ji49W]|uniref:Fic family protein n=1 Tax=Undibacterium sp. Ji49W TaxID=3413040 RepID=UPI003BF012D7
MRYEVITKPEYCKLFGKIECRETETSLLSCLAVLLNSWGVKVRLTHLLSLAPLAHGQVSGKLLLVLTRRLGMQTMRVVKEDLATALASWPVLVLCESGFCFLLLKIEHDHFVAALPGYAEQVCKVFFDAELLQQPSVAYAVRMPHLGPAIPKQERHPKLYLLPWQDSYRSAYDRSAFSAFEAQAAKLPRVFFFPPQPLTALTTSALMASHASICPTRPQYYGCYRDFNLKRGDTVFVQHTELSASVEALLAVAREHHPDDAQTAVQFAARLFSDFLAIHPFVNANQRMAMLIVTNYLSKWNLSMQWKHITSTQYYYWMRLATRGHICFLENGLKANVGQC